MSSRGKRRTEVLEQVDRKKAYELEEAIELLKSLRPARFDETIELVVQLRIDPRQSEQQVRGSFSLPNGLGKVQRVVVFAEGEAAEAALKAGADHVGAADLVERIQGGWTGFDVALAAPEMMRLVGRLGRVLGVRTSVREWQSSRPARLKCATTAAATSTPRWANCLSRHRPCLRTLRRSCNTCSG